MAQPQARDRAMRKRQPVHRPRAVELISFVLVGWLMAFLLCVPVAHGVAVVPPQFDDTLVATVPAPTALAFTPDGRLLITSKPGTLQVYKNGALLASPALDFTSRICSDLERGLLGVAVDPSFASNRYIYLYYTFKKHGVCDTMTANTPVNRVHRQKGIGESLRLGPDGERPLSPRLSTAPPRRRSAQGTASPDRLLDAQPLPKNDPRVRRRPRVA